ncbi:MAG TPA: hypothetical protein PKA42_02520 [Candidatus Paceibacterota bacterium]|nr:hypothetical protein [Candidatus Paceibacterota bacterium]HMO83018.1 hypothetical protein [Candidatus Paceibacterota bacterium]
MNFIEYSEIFELVPSALAVTLFLYLIHFFGKIIVDQIPYSDDRRWSIQLHGTIFMVNMLAGGFGIWLAVHFPLGIGEGWLHFWSFVILGLIGGTLLCHTLVESSKLYSHRTKQIEKLNKMTDGFFLFYAKIGSRIGVGVLPIILFYFGTLEYFTESIPWMIFSFTFIFIIFVWSALGYSLRLIKELPQVNIYFADSNIQPLIGAKLIKVSDDTVRVRSSNTIILLNKNNIQKIEMEIPDSSL